MSIFCSLFGAAASKNQNISNRSTKSRVSENSQKSPDVFYHFVAKGLPITRNISLCRLFIRFFSFLWIDFMVVNLRAPWKKAFFPQCSTKPATCANLSYCFIDLDPSHGIWWAYEWRRSSSCDSSDGGTFYSQCYGLKKATWPSDDPKI